VPEYTDGYNVRPPRVQAHGGGPPGQPRGGSLLTSAARYALERKPLVGLMDGLARRHHRRSHPTFSVGGKAYPYSSAVPLHREQRRPPWILFERSRPVPHSDLYSERAVEIPFAHAFYLGNRGPRTLEVGNVLANRFEPPAGYDVVDKYEAGPRIRNEDIATFRASEPYDLILSVSTIEHVGLDEAEKDPAKPLRAIRNMAGMLAPSGRLMITVPFTYNPAVDRMLQDAQFAFTQRYFLKRVCRWGCWAETTLEDALGRRYGSRYPCANAVAFLVLDRSGSAAGSPPAA
jgi:SAM-dependent methyltransferase